jgi:hypothetical protein
MNAIKLCSEFQIFGILLACVVLQTHEKGDRIAMESFTIDDYGTAQVVLTLAIVPITAYVLGKGIEDMRAQGGRKKQATETGTETNEAEFENPVAMDSTTDSDEKDEDAE